MKTKNIYFAYRSFWPEQETVRKFHECGIDPLCFFASNTTNSKRLPYRVYPLVWPAPEQYDFPMMDRQIGAPLPEPPGSSGWPISTRPVHVTFSTGISCCHEGV